MATQAENDAITNAKGAAQAAAENAKYQAKKLAAANSKEEPKKGIRLSLAQRGRQK